MTGTAPLEIQIWPIDRLVLYARNPRKNDGAVDRMCSSIREYGFKIPVLARSDGEVIDGHLRLKAARKLRIDQIPVILCDEWTPAQVKAFRLMVNRSVNWATWDDELLREHWLDILLNIVAFIPLGFTLCTGWGSRWSLGRAIVIAVCLGFATSFTIEFFQSFLPRRNSGTTDLITNTFGTYLGATLFYTNPVRRFLVKLTGHYNQGSASGWP